MFWTYSQNNSGGRFECNDNICAYVIIEADDANKADRFARAIGIYFDGVSKGIDCECCGNRWYASSTWGDSGNAVPSVYGDEVTTDWHQEYSWTDPVAIVHYKNGEKLVIKKHKRAYEGRQTGVPEK